MAELRYGFGTNWKSFVEHALNDARVASAVESMRRLVGEDTLRDRTFLDVGCGSGLFTLAALLLGASHATGFDLDPHSVSTSMALRERFGIPEDRWAVRQGSVLDPAFMADIDTADVVYAWGSLHHTGAMWDAIAAAAAKVRPGGTFVLAIYNHVRHVPDRSEMWWHIKRAYNRSGPIGRRAMESVYVTRHVLTRLVTLRNPFAGLLDRGGEGRRGMEFLHDVRDWLGGFPYEFATAGEVFQAVHDQHGLELQTLVTCEGNACNEFVFRRPAPDHAV